MRRTIHLDRHRQPTPATTSRLRLVGALVLAPLLTLATVFMASSPTAAAEAPSSDDGWIRGGHLAAGEGSADIRLTPFSGGKTVTVPNVAYGDITPFNSVPAGLYTVAVVAAGSPASATPMVSASVRVKAGQATSVFAIGKKGEVRSTVLQDDLTAPPEGQARVRLLSAAGTDESVGATLSNGTELASDVPQGKSTGYLAVGAQTWSINVSTSSGAKAMARVPVEAGGVYTLIAAQKATGEGVRLEAVLDANGASTMPRGGVDTGGGWLANSTDAGSARVGGLLLGALGLVVLSAAFIARPRRLGALISR